MMRGLNKFTRMTAIAAVLAGPGLLFLPSNRSSDSIFKSRTLASDGMEPYAFGSCPSQGAWTQAALENMRNLYGVISRLKDNPKCKGKENTIDGIVANFQTAEEELKLPAGDQFATEVESLPGEIDALRQVLPGTKGGLSEVMSKLLFKKTLQAATIGSKRAAENPEPNAVSVDPTTAVRALYKRTNRASRYGIKMVQQIFGALPGLDECIMGQPDAGLAMIGAAVKVGAAFAASGDSVGNSLGSAIGSLVTMLRDRRFTMAMRQLNEREFWMSISCMLETTTKNYCEAENAQEMIQFAQNEYERTMKNVRTGLADPNSDNPLEGYYLLSRELPAISNWLSQLKLGSEPKTTADASQQKEAIEKINEFWKMKKDVSGFMNLRIRTIMALPELSARQNGMLQLVRELYGMLSGNRSASIFILQSQRDAYLPFYLIGLKDIPEIVRPNAKNVRRIEWDEWMESGGDNGGLQEQFLDPVALSKTIEDQVRTLMISADANAAAFFRQYLVVDLQNLVNLTLTGQNLTVRESFVHVVRYLERFEKRLSQSDVDAVMLPSVRETQMRLRKILKSYERMMALGRDYRSGKFVIDGESQAVDAAAKAIIDTVFDQFNVLYQSDVFLTNRMTTFIQRDFAMRLRQGIGLTSHQREILFVTQDHLVQRLLQNFGQNMTMAKSDLSSAQVVNRTSLYSFEEVFGDQIYLILEELNEIVHGRDASPEALRRLAKKRFVEDRDIRRAMIPTMAQVLPAMAPAPVPMTLSWRGFLDWFIPGRRIKAEHPDLYVRPLNSQRITGGDTRFGDFARFRAMLCAQTLSFQKRERYQAFCADAVLTSAYSSAGADQLGNLDLRYADFWPATSNRSELHSYAKKVKIDPRATSQRICAYNNFSMRNWVRMLQDRDAREDSMRTEGEFDFEKEERLAKEAAEKKAAEEAQQKATQPTDESRGAESSASSAARDTLTSPAGSDAFDDALRY